MNVNVNVNVNVSEGAEFGGSFDFRRLDVYRAALKFVRWRSELLRRMKPGNADLEDQIRRAGSSILLNIAEGSGEFSRADRARFFRMARRSAAECAAVLDELQVTGVFGGEDLEEGRALLLRIIAMLTGFCRSLAKPEARR